MITKISDERNFTDDVADYMQFIAKISDSELWVPKHTPIVWCFGLLKLFMLDIAKLEQCERR
eukprot:SAG31_NODE_26419_length_442_cov_1.743440_1_plen_62_part_00